MINMYNIVFSGEPFFILFQPFPMYHVSTTWMQVVPKLSPKGRDLLQVLNFFIFVMLYSHYVT